MFVVLRFIAGKLLEGDIIGIGDEIVKGWEPWRDERIAEMQNKRQLKWRDQGGDR